MSRFTYSIFFVLLGLVQGIHGSQDSHDGQLCYEQIAQMYLQSLKNEVRLDDGRDISLPARDMRAIVFSLFEKFGAQAQGKNISPLRPLAHDLNLFTYPTKNNGTVQSATLFSKINRTQTVFGEVVLAHQVANPISDVNELRNRQPLIKRLVEDEKLFNELDREISKVKKHEDKIILNYCLQDPSAKQMIAEEFFDKNGYLQTFNTSPIAHELAEKGNFINKVVPTATGCAAGVVITGRGVVQELQEGLLDIAWASYAGNGRTIARNLVRDGLLLGISIPFPIIGMVRNIIAPPTGGAAASNLMGNVAMSVLSFYNLQNILGHLKGSSNIKDLLFAQTSGIASLHNSATKLREFIRNNPTLTAHIPLAAQESTQSELAQLKELFESGDFKNKPSFFRFNTGSTKAAYHLLQEPRDNDQKPIKYDFIDSMKLVGHIDACLSVAKLYKEHKKNDVGYEFVDFVEGEKPLLEAQGFWNPMIAPDKVVPNSIALGGDQAPGAIVTGSNTGGKSTVAINGLASTVVLAQTLGIAPAKSLKLKPFTYIATLKNTTDDVNDGTSRYHAEVKTAVRTEAAIANLRPTETAFVAADEAFEGTIPSVGSRTLYQSCQNMTKQGNAIVVVASQYAKDGPVQPITELADDPKAKGLFTNYKIDVIKNSDGSIERPRKLAPGVTTVSIAHDLYQQERSKHGLAQQNVGCSL